jgi:hypothetical protein
MIHLIPLTKTLIPPPMTADVPFGWAFSKAGEIDAIGLKL